MLPAISQKTILKQKTDVLVIGAGLAGIIGAISAAEAGAEVCLVSSGHICSGSSFYPGTWGFGLVGPESPEDEADLVNQIIEIGGHVVDKELVKVFVSEINASIQFLSDMGVPLKAAENPGEREFIPCFDHKCRSWHGIVKEDAKPVFLKRLKELGVTLLPHTEITQLLQDPEEPRGVVGAVGEQKEKGRIEIFSKSVILASGGLGGLYQHRLNPGDVTGMGHFLALKAGATLVNIEFMQMMPGYISPAYGTVFNEKVFRYTCSPVYDRWSPEKRKELLELRSGYGPYTSRLSSRLVDEAIANAWKCDGDGALIFYNEEIKKHQPEFVKTYFSWLEKEKHLTLEDAVRVGMFAHASNGGIAIDTNGFTGVPGLYACGEATGGMHGADRIGGLSTANGLVFGRRAGAAAALAATKVLLKELHLSEPSIEAKADRMRQIKEANVTREALRLGMTACAMIGRNEKQCGEMLDWLREQGVKWNRSSDDNLEILRLNGELMVATGLIEAIVLRKESRGSHNRADYPTCDPWMARMIACSYRNNKVRCRWI